MTMTAEQFADIMAEHMPDVHPKTIVPAAKAVARAAKQHYGRYKPDSKTHHNLAELEKQGLLLNRGTLWTQEHTDQLFDLYLDETSTEEDILALNLRGPNAWRTEIRTKSIRRNQIKKNRCNKNIYVPSPDWTPCRDGMLFNYRDRYIMHLATNETGRKYGAGNPLYI